MTGITTFHLLKQGEGGFHLPISQVWEMGSGDEVGAVALLAGRVSVGIFRGRRESPPEQSGLRGTLGAHIAIRLAPSGLAEFRIVASGAGRLVPVVFHVPVGETEV